MADITASMVKDLRETTGAGMMDCKKALQETSGDMQAAQDWLRTKGLAKAAKKADRIAAEGVVAVAVRANGKGMVGAAIELNSETDFVARNQTFQNAARQVAAAALDVTGDVEALRAAKTSTGQTVSDLITGLIATIGENMTVRRFVRFDVAEGAIGAYVHNKVEGATDLGRMGVLVAVEGAGPQAILQDLGKNIALHAAGHSPPPLSLSADELDPATVQKEREIQTATAAESGKPAGVVEKMVEGRIRKWMEEVVLLKQAYVKNPDQTVEQLVADTAKAVGSPIKVAGFARLALGEGVEKKADDFAAEVAAMTGAS
ncbi:MAG TPA: translation elongation factor Ts [Caulobacteraceae bacterium]|jgi:elongation factor Ts|nr:translation elongation factor Ts [Caulobacteraceae bacterium]